MRISSAEANKLRSCHDGTILSINSFVSTSLSSTVAMMYLGTDPYRDIMLEILVDKTLLDSESSPFADIRVFSAFPDEQEVLLSMGITLQVQSVTDSHQKKNMHIRARLYYEEDVTLKELKAFTLKVHLQRGQDESYYISSIADFLFWISDDEKIEQFKTLLNSNIQNARTKAVDCQIQNLDVLRQISKNKNIDSILHLVPKSLSDTAEMVEALANHSNVSDCMRETLLNMAKSIPKSPLQQSVNELIDNSFRMSDYLVPIVSSLDKFINLVQMPSSYPLLQIISLIKCLAESYEGNHEEALKSFEAICASSSVTASILDENYFGRMVVTCMARSAAALADNDRSLRILENLSASGKPHEDTLVALAQHYERIEDMPMAIACYRAVIDNCNLPPNSMAIVDAYYSIGSAFSKLEDIESSLLNYHRARELLLQHHPPTHPFLIPLQRIISIHECLHKLNELMKQVTTSLRLA